ncbi:hypothetical protein EI94DRAFT_1094556 [Lactarius quietus]|nr:hypothetical protein EI94DRAFT_1094556 [Lactarius quietus]
MPRFTKCLIYWLLHAVGVGRFSSAPERIPGVAQSTLEDYKEVLSGVCVELSCESARDATTSQCRPCRMCE